MSLLNSSDKEDARCQCASKIMQRQRKAEGKSCYGGWCAFLSVRHAFENHGVCDRALTKFWLLMTLSSFCVHGNMPRKVPGRWACLDLGCRTRGVCTVKPPTQRPWTISIGSGLNWGWAITLDLDYCGSCSVVVTNPLQELPKRGGGVVLWVYGTRGKIWFEKWPYLSCDMDKKASGFESLINSFLCMCCVQNVDKSCRCVLDGLL